MKLRTIRNTVRALPRNDQEAASADVFAARMGFVLCEITAHGARVYRRRDTSVQFLRSANK